MDQGMDPSAIFCNANNTAEATGTPSSRGGARRTGGSGADATGGSEGDEEGAAPAVGVSKMGLGMLGMVLVSALTGALS
jgi:unsaturated rhamnogalacturonyl hydrolase